MVIATKVGFNRDDIGPSLSRATIESEIDGSLRRLQTDYVDLVHVHACDTVERLLELQLTRHGIERTDKPPVLLQLLNRTTCRNWEGLVRLDQQGFLLMTDEYPAAILAFVPFP